MKKNSDLDKSFTKSIHKFLNTNNWVIVIGILFTFLYLSLKLGTVLNQTESNEKLIRQDIGKVIFLTSDGKVLELNKQKVSYADSRVADYLANIIQYDLIQDLVSISHGFKVQYSNAKELVQKYKPFNDFKKYLLNPK